MSEASATPAAKATIVEKSAQGFKRPKAAEPVKVSKNAYRRIRTGMHIHAGGRYATLCGIVTKRKSFIENHTTTLNRSAVSCKACEQRLKKMLSSDDDRLRNAGKAVVAMFKKGSDQQPEPETAAGKGRHSNENTAKAREALA